MYNNGHAERFQFTKRNSDFSCSPSLQMGLSDPSCYTDTSEILACVSTTHVMLSYSEDDLVFDRSAIAVICRDLLMG